MKHGETIYCDYQASTPIDDRVLDAMYAASKAHFANPHASDHILGWRAAAAIAKATEKVAKLFGLQGVDVCFTSGASEANAMALSTALEISRRTGRNKIIVGQGDHVSVLNEAAISSLDSVQIPLDQNGAPDIGHLKTLISEQTALVSIIGVNNENGAIADIKAIGMLCREMGALLHVDLAQAPLAIDIDLIELEIAFATISAHKIYGPKGIGAFLAAPGLSNLVRGVIKGAGQQEGRRGGTMPTDLIVGFGEASRILAFVGEEERLRVGTIRDYFVKSLRNEQIGELVGRLEGRHPGNALIRFPEVNASDLLARLQPFVAASSQSACSSASIVPSLVVQAMGFDQKFARECARFSFGRFSEIKQIDTVIYLIKKALLEIANS
jgi:cysteine desulfurase